jgi:hypothetical protein
MTITTLRETKCDYDVVVVKVVTNALLIRTQGIYRQERPQANSLPTKSL